MQHKSSVSLKINPTDQQAKDILNVSKLMVRFVNDVNQTINKTNQPINDLQLLKETIVKVVATNPDYNTLSTFMREKLYDRLAQMVTNPNYKYGNTLFIDIPFKSDQVTFKENGLVINKVTSGVIKWKDSSEVKQPSFSYGFIKIMHNMLDDTTSFNVLFVIGETNLIIGATGDKKYIETRPYVFRSEQLKIRSTSPMIGIYFDVDGSITTSRPDKVPDKSPSGDATKYAKIINDCDFKYVFINTPRGLHKNIKFDYLAFVSTLSALYGIRMICIPDAKTTCVYCMHEEPHDDVCPLKDKISPSYNAALMVHAYGMGILLMQLPVSGSPRGVSNMRGRYPMYGYISSELDYCDSQLI